VPVTRGSDIAPRRSAASSIPLKGLAPIIFGSPWSMRKSSRKSCVPTSCHA